MTTTLPFHRIKRVAVLGSGVMGSAIACHLAQCGAEVMLLDLPADGDNRNAVCERAIERLLNPNAPGLLHKDNLERITIGNIEDDFGKLADIDWIAEAVVERLDVKKARSKRIDEVRKPGSIASSNT